MGALQLPQQLPLRLPPQLSQQLPQQLPSLSSQQLSQAQSQQPEGLVWQQPLSAMLQQQQQKHKLQVHTAAEQLACQLHKQTQTGRKATTSLVAAFGSDLYVPMQLPLSSNMATAIATSHMQQQQQPPQRSFVVPKPHALSLAQVHLESPVHKQLGMQDLKSLLVEIGSRAEHMFMDQSADTEDAALKQLLLNSHKELKHVADMLKKPAASQADTVLEDVQNTCESIERTNVSAAVSKTASNSSNAGKENAVHLY